jgi:hypothetical protein
MQSAALNRYRPYAIGFILSLLCFILFGLLLTFRIPPEFSRFFHAYSFPLFLLVLIAYYFAFRLEARFEAAVSLGLIMILTALSLSYIWTSGFSDNFIIGGLLPYKDAKNYFVGTQLLLNGSAVVNAGQATERPLFPGFLSVILWLTDQNLQIATAITTCLIALGIYISSKQIHHSYGTPAASLFATLLYFYIQPIIGYTMSEVLGFIAGCFGFALVWSAAQSRRWIDLMIGIFALLLAVSARAGAFFIFPLLALWAGWTFRGEKRFSFKAFGYVSIGIILGYLVLNSAYSRLLGIPAGSSFTNFSYALYGQVRGGTGWHSAIEDLGTRNAAVVYHETWIFFLKHPVSLFIGFAKSYRDFFFGSGSMLPFGNFGFQNGLNSLVWIVILALLATATVISLKKFSNPLSSLVLAGLIGIFLSIPFLPPIDGGSRFYAATAPFFCILPALGIAYFPGRRASPETLHNCQQPDVTNARYASIAVMVIILFLSPLAFFWKDKDVITSPSCPAGQDPFRIVYHSGSYLDFIRPGANSCGFVPAVCQADFKSNNTERSNDDFYQKLFDLMESEEASVRIIPAYNLANGRFHYIFVTLEKLAASPVSGESSGCAIEVLTKNQTIYQVQSWSLNEE